MEDDFYATIKFKNGEEIFAKVAVSEEENRTMLVLSNPVMATEVKAKGGLVGYKVEPWLKTSREDMFIIDKADILTISESNDVHMISMFQQFVEDSDKVKTLSKLIINISSLVVFNQGSTLYPTSPPLFFISLTVTGL